MSYFLHDPEAAERGEITVRGGAQAKAGGRYRPSPVRMAVIVQKLHFLPGNGNLQFHI
jgi:hypothetical protein